MGSATPALIPGTQRRLSVTAGSYVDFDGVVNFAQHAAADVTLRVFVDAVAVGEGASQSVVTADDTGSVAVKVRYGPITTAQAAAGIVTELRIGASADTVSITAATTPATFSAVLTATELTVTNPQGSPSNIPHLLLWLSADSGVTYDKTTKRVTAWTDQSGAKTLAYDGQSGNFAAGLLVTGGTSGATGLIHQDTDAGATGTLLLTDVRGTFVDNEVLTDSSTGAAVVNGTAASLVITPGTSAPRYEASVINSLPGLYFSADEANNFALADLPTQATAFEIFAVVSYSAFGRAGASLLNPPVAQAADCLRAVISNATVNRSALFDTNKPEYVGTATTVTSGKALFRLRYNVGTTTGAGAVNGGAETADTSFDPPSFTWAFIGSTTNATFKLGDFRLCELLIYSLVQASTEDAVSASDCLAVRDYLNDKWRVY